MSEENSEGLNLLIGILVIAGILGALLYLENPDLYWDISSSIQTVVAVNLAYVSQLMILGFIATNFAWWKFERFMKLTLQGSRLRKIKTAKNKGSHQFVSTLLVVGTMLGFGFTHHAIRFVDILDDGGFTRSLFLSVDLFTWVVLGGSFCVFIISHLARFKVGSLWSLAKEPKIINGLVLGTELSDFGKKRVG